MTILLLLIKIAFVTTVIHNIIKDIKNRVDTDQSTKPEDKEKRN